MIILIIYNITISTFDNKVLVNCNQWQGMAQLGAVDNYWVAIPALRSKTTILPFI